jgi:catechol 2,3-dioxygenase-like lactoylglutathione lyase family enzyme
MSDRPGIKGQITFLYTNDLERAGEFYQDVMGLRLALDQGTCRIYRTGKGAYLGICQVKGDQKLGDRKGVIFTLVVEDVDGWFAYLGEKGVHLQEEPQESQEYGIYHFFLKDPDGYVLEVQCFLDRNWDGVG